MLLPKLIIFFQVAIKIEDTTHVEVLYDGADWTAGFVPYTIRTELMRKHLGNMQAGIIDHYKKY